MWVAADFIPFLQVPPSCWGARAKAKRIRHVTQLPITPGIRAFLIPLLILMLYNWGSLQLCFSLRVGGRSCSEGRAFRRVWAVACQLQLPGLILNFTAEIHPLEQSAARGLERQMGLPEMLCGQPSITKDLETKGLRGSALPRWKVKIGAQLASRQACSRGERFCGISRDSLGWPLGKQIGEIHPWHRWDLLEIGLVVERGPAEIPGVQGLYQCCDNCWLSCLTSSMQRQKFGAILINFRPESLVVFLLLNK